MTTEHSRDRTALQGSAESLFDSLDRLKPFHPSEEGRPWLIDCPFEVLRDVAADLWFSSPFQRERVDSRFSFFTSGSLSGIIPHCVDLECRARSCDSLKGFAALYADLVLIQDPFESVLQAEDAEMLRWDFVNRLAMLYLLRPEIEAGFVKFTPSVFSLCNNHQAAFDEDLDRVWSALATAGADALSRLEKNLTAQLLSTDQYDFIALEGPENYVAHGRLDLVPTPGAAITEGATLREIIGTWIVDPVIRELEDYAAIRWLYGARYVTDRLLDSELLSAVSHERIPDPIEIPHQLPYIAGLDVDALVQLRKNEGEAFQVYRDRIRTLEAMLPMSSQELTEAFRDLVEPELHRIDKAVASARKMVRKEVRHRMFFGTAVASVGLASGFDYAGIAAAMGGVTALHGLYDQLAALIEEPATARESDFYFLWKARQVSR